MAESCPSAARARACADEGAGPCAVGVDVDDSEAILRRRENEVLQFARLANAPAGPTVCRGTGAASGEPEAGT